MVLESLASAVDHGAYARVVAAVAAADAAPAAGYEGSGGGKSEVVFERPAARGAAVGIRRSEGVVRI